MIFFSPVYRENKEIVYHYYLHRYLDFTDLVKRISRMVRELLTYNELLDYNEAIKILKKDNSEPLKVFAIGDLKRYISTK